MTHTSMDNMDVVFLLDNESMYNVCRNSLCIERPSYSNINRYCVSRNSEIQKFKFLVIREQGLGDNALVQFVDQY